MKEGVLMFSYTYDDDIKVSLPVPHIDAPKLFPLIKNSGETISTWLPWAKNLQTISDEESFLKMVLKNFGTGDSLNCVVHFQDQPVGMISLNKIDKTNNCADIGYWLGSEWTHRGIMHRAVSAIIAIGFTEYHLNKITIEADVNNLASNKVAEKLNFHLDGTKREALKYSDYQFGDMNEWSLLKKEWQKVN